MERDGFKSCRHDQYHQEVTEIREPFGQYFGHYKDLAHNKPCIPGKNDLCTPSTSAVYHCSEQITKE